MGTVWAPLRRTPPYHARGHGYTRNDLQHKTHQGRCAYNTRQASSNFNRGDLGNNLLPSPYPRLTRKFDFQLVPSKNSESTFALSNPDIGPQSSLTERAATIRYAPCSVPLRKAVDWIRAGFPANHERASTCGNSSGSFS